MERRAKHGQGVSTSRASGELFTELARVQSGDRTDPNLLVHVVRNLDEQHGDYAIEQLLVRYQHANVVACTAEGLAHVSLATDKSRVWGGWEY